MKNTLVQYCIYHSDTILSAIERIEQNNMRTIFVLNDSDKVVGVISQGDVLRALIEGTSLYAQAKKIMTASFTYLREKDLHKAVKVFLTKYYSLIPVISEDFELIDVILFTEVIEILVQRNKGQGVFLE